MTDYFILIDMPTLIDMYHFLNTKKVRDLESKSISSNKGINLTKPLDQILTGH